MCLQTKGIIQSAKLEETSMTEISEKSNRPFIRNLAVYSATAWAAVEVIDFMVTRYSFAGVLVDISVFLAVVGCVIVIVLTWFHGKSGRQEIHAIEKIILGGLALLALTGVIFLSTQDPRQDFLEAEGFRLTLEFAGPSSASDGIDYDGFNMDIGETWRDLDGAIFKEGMFDMSPTEFSFDYPGVQLEGQHHPVMYLYPLWSKDEFGRLTIVLPSRPSAIDSLLQISDRHESAQIKTTNLSTDINRAFKLTDQGDSVIIRLEGPFHPGLPSQ